VIFNNQKKTKVKYIIYPSEIPQGVFAEIKKYPTIIKKTGCPAVQSIDNKFWYVNSYIDMEIEFGFKNNESYFKYKYNEKIHPKTDFVHNLINSNIFINTAITNGKNYLDLQIGSPYAFITDDKHLEVNTIPPQIEYNNCVYVPGGLKPANWIRTLNSAFILDNPKKPASIKFSVNKPMLSFYFNKPIDLQYTEYDGKIKQYHERSNNIVNYRKKLEENIMKNIIKKRKKKLL